MESGSPPTSRLTSLSFAESPMAPAPEEKKTRGQVEARKRRSTQKPEGGKDENKKEAFIIRQSFGTTGRELISFISTPPRKIGMHDVEAPTKADETMLLHPGSEDEQGV